MKNKLKIIFFILISIVLTPLPIGSMECAKANFYQFHLNATFNQISILLFNYLRSKKDYENNLFEAIELLQTLVSEELYKQEIGGQQLGNDALLKQFFVRALLNFQKRKSEKLTSNDLCNLLKIKFSKYLLDYLTQNTHNSYPIRLQNEIIKIITSVLEPLKISSASNMNIGKVKVNHILINVWLTLVQHNTMNMPLQKYYINKSINEIHILIKMLKYQIYCQIKHNGTINTNMQRKLQKFIGTLAYLYGLLEKYETAKFLYSKALEMDVPNNVAIRINILLGEIQILGKQKNYKKFIENTKRLIVEITKQENNSYQTSELEQIYSCIKEIIYLYLKEYPDLLDQAVYNINKIILSEKHKNFIFEMAQIAQTKNDLQNYEVLYKRARKEDLELLAYNNYLKQREILNLAQSLLSQKKYIETIKILKNIKLRNNEIIKAKNYLNALALYKLGYQCYKNSSSKLNHYKLLTLSIQNIEQILQSENSNQKSKYYTKCIDMLIDISRKCCIPSFVTDCKRLLEHYA